MIQLSDIELDVLASIRRKAAPLHKIGRELHLNPGQTIDALERLIELGHVERHAMCARLGARHREVFYRERFSCGVVNS